MAQRYVLSEEAVRDLLDLQSFLAEREGDNRALMVIARLHRAMMSLADYPGVGRRRKDLEGEPLAYPVKSWMIFYRPTADLTGIEIVRILDGRRDIQMLFGGTDKKA